MLLACRHDSHYSLTLPVDSQGGLSEKEAEIRASLARLDEAAHSDKPLSADDLSTLRRQLEDSSISLREHQDRAKQVTEENEMLTRRRDELETRLSTLEQEYEELLGAPPSNFAMACRHITDLDRPPEQTRRSPTKSETTRPTCRTSGCAASTSFCTSQRY